MDNKYKLLIFQTWRDLVQPMLRNGQIPCSEAALVNWSIYIHYAIYGSKKAKHLQLSISVLFPPSTQRLLWMSIYKGNISAFFGDFFRCFWQCHNSQKSLDFFVQYFAFFSMRKEFPDIILVDSERGDFSAFLGVFTPIWWLCYKCHRRLFFYISRFSQWGKSFQIWFWYI
jgi:hypothetical protein